MIQRKIITSIFPSRIESDRINLRQNLCIDLPVTFYKPLSSINELFPLLSDPSFHTDFIAIDIEYLYKIEGAEIFDIIKTISTLLNCTVQRIASGKPVKRNTKILGIVGYDADPKLVKEILGLLDGIALKFGGPITYEDIREDFKKILNGDFSVPKIVQEILKKDKKKHSGSKNSGNQEIDLTPRQTQILHLLSHRGASNKVIAKTLNISESTVKLHMSAILKKFGVRNRTQLAVFSNKIEQ